MTQINTFGDTDQRLQLKTRIIGRSITNEIEV